MHCNKSVSSGVCVRVCVFYLYCSWPAITLISPTKSDYMYFGCVRVFFLFHLMYVYYTKCIHCLRLMISALLIAVFHLIILICVCVCAYLFLYSESTKGKSDRVLSFVCSSFGKTKISTLSNKSTNDRACQSNESNASDCFHQFPLCLQTILYFIFVQSVCLQPKITLAIVYQGLKWLKYTNQPRFCRWSVSSDAAQQKRVPTKDHTIQMMLLML